MSSSDVDDDSSYESVAEERIGGILHEAVLEVNEEIAIAQRPASPPCTDAGHQNMATDDNSIESRRSSLRAVFPPFFFPNRPGSASSTSSGGGGGGLHCPVQSFHLNRRRTWGSAIAHRLVMESVVPATVFRAVVAVFHLWLERSGGDGDDCDCDDDSYDPSRSRLHGTCSNPCDDTIASAPMEEIVSYLKFLARECGVGDAVARGNHHVDVDEDIDPTAIWHHFLPSLAEASRQSIAEKTIIRSMEDTADPMALEIDLEACRSITLGEWKAFLSIPREHVPSADQLADGSSDFIALLEWWNSLPQLLGAKGAVEVSDQQPLYDFLVEYCRAINVSVMKYTCHGWTSAIGCVHRRRCGVMLNRLGHSASARTAFYNGAMGRLVACDLIRTNGKMKLSVGFVRNSCHTRNIPVIEEAECTDECDRSVSCSEPMKSCEDAKLDTSDDAASMKDDEEQKVKALRSEKLVDLFPSEDEDISNEPRRVFRRIKRGIATTTTPTRDGTVGTVRTSISNAEKRLRCEKKNNANCCEVSRAWADARDTYGVHSDEDDHESL